MLYNRDNSTAGIHFIKLVIYRQKRVRFELYTIFICKKNNFKHIKRP